MRKLKSGKYKIHIYIIYFHLKKITLRTKKIYLNQLYYLYNRFHHYLITLGILLITIAVDAFRFFELTPTFDQDGEFSGFDYTNLRKDQTYVKVYTLWYRLVMTAAIPFSLMVFLNFRIVVYYRKNK